VENPSVRSALPVADDPYPGGMTRSAAFFDLDKTIIAKSSTLAFSKPFFEGGLLNRRAVLRSAYAQFMFAVSGADHDQLAKMRDYLTKMVTGWDVDVVRRSVAETLHTIIDPLIYDEAVNLIEDHREAGHDIVIVSASGSEVVEPIGAMLDADHIIATRLVESEGRYTGELEFYAYGPNKAEAMRELAAECGYQLDRCYAYSDSQTDAPMLQVVGYPHAVNPDKPLRKLAQENGWPILTFGNPVSMRSRLGLGGRAGKLVATAVLIVGLGAVGTALARRRACERLRITLRSRRPGIRRGFGVQLLGNRTS